MEIIGKDEYGKIIPVEITHKGSLGLLAFGYKGIQLWKKAREESGFKNLCDPEVKLKIENPIKRSRKAHEKE